MLIDESVCQLALMGLVWIERGVIFESDGMPSAQIHDCLSRKSRVRSGHLRDLRSPNNTTAAAFVVRSRRQYWNALYLGTFWMIRAVGRQRTPIGCVVELQLDSTMLKA